MKRLLLLVALLYSPIALSEMGFPEKALPGKYILIGKAIDSERTYVGSVQITTDGEKLVLTRQINGETVVGSAAVESALHGDAQVLRFRFRAHAKEFEETCLFQGDLDNYARISCYLYQPDVPTANPGLEALFSDHAAGL